MPERPVHEQIKELSQSLVLLSDKVLKNFTSTFQNLADPDAEASEMIRMAEDDIDISEVRLEEKCLVFLALQQPVARDLRKIITIVKINNDLERIADLVMHIYERTEEVDAAMVSRYRFEEMAEITKDMIQKSIQAFVNSDRKLAEEVMFRDEELDTMHREVFRSVAGELKESGSDSGRLMVALSVSRYIERMGDHATRIAQEVLYLVTGEIVRHVEGSFEKLVQSLKD